MCNWISIKDRLPQGHEDFSSLLVIPDGECAPLLLWDAYDKEVGEVHIGFFDNGKFGVYDKEIDETQLNITHWAIIEPPSG